MAVLREFPEETVIADRRAAAPEGACSLVVGGVC
jgi:hypothetical protein